ncbi:hypothetical protein AB4Z30_25305 [Paenibacillus sp. 2TAF8]|uniref:hypothetical protein n=1 Tax=Paenibacillus sp. 2TAF8 TaxID=3233020 RepID=UPI003F9709C8
MSNENELYLAYVDELGARQIWPEGRHGYMKLTTISIQTPQPPEDNLLKIDQLVERAIVISGVTNGDYIWSSKIEELSSITLSNILKNFLN